MTRKPIDTPDFGINNFEFTELLFTAFLRFCKRQSTSMVDWASVETRAVTYHNN